MPKHNLKDIELDEVSLVDKGANPGAHVVLFKRDVGDVGFDDVLLVLEKIITVTVVDDMAVKKADDYISVDQLMKTAHSFNDMVALQENREAMDKLGDKFGALHGSLISIIEDSEVSNKRMAAHMSLNEFHESVLNSLKEVAKMADKKTDLEKQVDELTEQLAKATGNIETLTKAKDDAEAKVAEMEKAAKEKDDKGKGKGKKDEKDGIDKSALSPEVREALEKGEKASERVAKLEDEAITKAFVAKAEGYSNLPIDAKKLGAILKGVSGNVEKELYEEFEKMLAGTHEGMGKVFTELGKNGGDGGGALEALTAKAGEIAKRDSITKEAAFVKAGEENPELAKQEREERSAVQH